MYLLGVMTMVSRLLLGVLLRARESALCRLILATTLVACTAGVNDCSAQLCGQLNGVNFSENFNTLATSGSSNLIPNTFEFDFNENPGNITYASDNGSNSAANTYSYGATGSTDRAFGEITS